MRSTSVRVRELPAAAVPRFTRADQSGRIRPFAPLRDGVGRGEPAAGHDVKQLAIPSAVAAGPAPRVAGPPAPDARGRPRGYGGGRDGTAGREGALEPRSARSGSLTRWVVALVLALLLAPAARAQDVDPAVEAAVDRGVAFLLARQAGKEDGRFDEGEYRAALTALAATALMSVGHQPTDPTPEGRALRAAIEYVLADEFQTEEGYFGRTDGSRMYGHGIVTLFLSELSGQAVDAGQERRVREKLEAAVALILRSQAVVKRDPADQGGWRYEPGSGDSDLSVSVWQVMALRSANAAGVAVPAEAIEEAVAYLTRSYRPEPGAAGGPGPGQMGRFGYTPSRNFTFSTTSAGLLAMQVCGRYEADAVAGAANWLLAQPVREGQQWFFYGLYYYAQGMHQRGGEHAEAARGRVEAALLPAQREDGSWGGGGSEGDPVYATSMAILSLSVRYHYLPIYQR